jgi:hypothetical protein
MKVDTGFIIGEIHQLVEDVSASLSFCKDDSIAAPPELDLSEPATKDPNDPALTQFRNMLAWDIPHADPDPGQAVSLRKYIPVDLLQVTINGLPSSIACYLINYYGALFTPLLV